MNISRKVNTSVIKFGAIFLVWLLLIFVQKLQAQDKKWGNPKFSFTGIEGSFGYKSARISSNIPELDQQTLIEEGGSIGAILGNDFSRFVIRPIGFYSAVGSFGRSVNLYSVEVENNTYLLRGLFKKPTRFDIYSSLGINYHSYKFFGHYVQKDQRPAYNNKAGKEPFLGRLDDLLISMGLGAEYRLRHNDDFLHLFLTAKTNVPIQSSVNAVAFEGTSLAHHLDIRIGMRFGLMNSNSFRYR